MPTQTSPTANAGRPRQMLWSSHAPCAWRATVKPGGGGTDRAGLPCRYLDSRIFGGVFGDADAKARPLLHALEDEIDAVGALPDHAALPRQDVVFLAHALLG